MASKSGVQTVKKFLDFGSYKHPDSTFSAKHVHRNSVCTGQASNLAPIMNPVPLRANERVHDFRLFLTVNGGSCDGNMVDTSTPKMKRSESITSVDSEELESPFVITTSQWAIDRPDSNNSCCDACKTAVYEGSFQKRGGPLKMWGERYGVLLEDSTLLTFKKQSADLKHPVRTYTVKECHSGCSETRFTLILLKVGSKIKRDFKVKSRELKTEWLNAVQHVTFKCCTVEITPHLSHHDVVNKPVTLDDFKLLNKLGAGSFGTVLLCEKRSIRELFAVKILEKRGIMAEKILQRTLTEKNVLEKNKCPFLPNMKFSFQTSDKLYFVMEYVGGGELFHHVSDRELSVAECRFYGAELVIAIEYLHEKNIIYRDLKLENVLVDKDGHIKLVDFGMCKEKMGFGARTKSLCGTPEYVAPEVLKEDYYDRAVDWWSLGVLMYELICGELPFPYVTLKALYDLIIKSNITPTKDLDPVAWNFLNGLLTKDPKKRLGGGHSDSLEVKGHPFFNGIDWQDVVKKKLDPPIKPVLSSDRDTRYFDDRYTFDSLSIYRNSGSQTEDNSFFKQFHYFEGASSNRQ